MESAQRLAEVDLVDQPGGEVLAGPIDKTVGRCTTDPRLRARGRRRGA